MLQLLPLTITKLFADQVVPTAGVSGNVLLVDRLKAIGVPREHAIAAIILAIIAYYLSYAARSQRRKLLLLDFFAASLERLLWLFRGMLQAQRSVAHAVPNAAHLDMVLFYPSRKCRICLTFWGSPANSHSTAPCLAAPFAFQRKDRQP
jgi:hypothetical protein